MQIFIASFVAIVAIGLAFFLVYKPRKSKENMVYYSNHFLVLNVLFLIVEAIILIYIAFFAKKYDLFIVLIIIALVVVSIFSLVLYKNFNVVFEEDYLIITNYRLKQDKIYYLEIDDFEYQKDMINLTAKGKTYGILNHKRYVKNTNNFIEFVKSKRK